MGRECRGNDNDRDDLFAATPPLEAKKSLIALASCQRGVPKHLCKKLGFIDIRKAYFHAKAKGLYTWRCQQSSANQESLAKCADVSISPYMAPAMPRLIGKSAIHRF